VEELKELKKARRSKHPVVAVVGMAGQGQSCLTGKWYNRRPDFSTSLEMTASGLMFSIEQAVPL
jgi:hypothetical protein